MKESISRVILWGSSLLCIIHYSYTVLVLSHKSFGKEGNVSLIVARVKFEPESSSSDQSSSSQFFFHIFFSNNIV